MIASLFRKSTPFNYTLLIIVVLVFFFIYQFGTFEVGLSTRRLVEKVMSLGLIFASLFILNFIVKKNGLSRDNSFTILFYFLFLLFFPSILDNFNLALSNFFVLLSLRRLISLHSLKSTKEKIFDASLWVFLAALFHFWSILFIVLVFISILFHAARDFRNWLLPIIASLAATITFFLLALIFDESHISRVFESTQTNFRIDYFTNSWQNISLSFYASVTVFFLASMFLSLSNRPLILHSSYKKIISAFFIGVAVYIISPVKSNDLLIFTFAPLAIMASSHVESTAVIWQREVIVASVTILAVLCFLMQL